MSRWLSPERAARRAERAAKEAAKLRKEKRRSTLLLIAVILLMIASTTAFWVFYAIPRIKNAQRHQPGSNTNAPSQPSKP